MKIKSLNYSTLLLSLSLLVRLPVPATAQSLMPVSNPPHLGTYYSLSHLLTDSPLWPPLPMLPFDVPVYLLSNDATNGPIYAFDDSMVDYDALDSTTAITATTMTPLGAGPSQPSPLYSTNDFYLSILLDTNNLGYIDLVLHNASSPTTYYQLLTNTALTKPLTWYPGQWLPGDAFTNDLWFSTIPYLAPNGALVNEFFRAVSGVAVVSVSLDRYESPIIAEPPGTPNTAWFIISVSPTNSTGLNVVYQLTGSALNGIDYTNIPTSVFIPPGVSSTNVFIQATNDNKIDFAEEAILSLVLTNGYLIDPNSWTAFITITDTLPNMIQAVITNLPVADLDYYSPSNSLIASAYYPNWATTNYFARIWTYITTNNGMAVTNVAITNWSYAGGSDNEVRLTVVKTNTNTGFHPGDTFFAPYTNSTIGWISRDGISFSNAWLVITNELNPFAGDIYVDQTGIWGGDLLVVSGRSDGLAIGNMNIWRINTNRQASLVASIPTSHLEGLITLPNNPTQYGPWSGKLITANEDEGRFYAVETNGNYQSFALDVGGDPIQPSAMRVIPANQNLYFSDPRPSSDSPLVLKIPQQYFTNFTGDILVTRAGEKAQPAALFIVHWDNALGEFVNNKIPYASQNPSQDPPFYGEYIEHATFAPLDLPPIPPQ